MYIFSMNHGMSKSAVSDSLACEKSSLPQPNCLPQSFREAKDFISPLLMPLEKYDACVNDCILYRDLKDKEYSSLQNCPICGEPRKKRGVVQKKYTYMPLGPRLSRWFGTSNLCKLLYSNRGVSANGNLRDFTDGKVYKSWFETGGVFQGQQECHTVPLSLFTDGVNPNKHMTSQKSMWPLILTWINLPFEIRQLLGPMLLVGVIPSGINGSEPKSLEPYLELLIDELLSLSEFTLYNAYEMAPMNVKVALLQYLCDIPAYSKVFHLPGHGALRSCPYCRDVGEYCKHLHKTIHLSNRRFLDSNHRMRSEDGFGKRGCEREQKPTSYTCEEEAELRKEFELKRNKSQKAKHQKETGLKGEYSLQKLPYHNRMQQMQADGMHTFADFVNHVLEMLTGKLSSEKVLHCEHSYARFTDIVADDEQLESRPKKKKTDKTQTSRQDSSRTIPWELTKKQIKEADKRACEIVYSQANGITPGPHFSKPWTLRTMSSKLQFVTTGGLQWCIRGFLPPKQEETLFFVFDTLKRVISSSIYQAAIEQLQIDVHHALCLVERDFPLSLQNLTTHLIHHIVDGLEEFGPVYGRWLFPYERANGWISRQCLRKGVEESTVMETYVVSLIKYNYYFSKENYC
ncbi:uncharacterized protein LOC134258258 [Saccostrea cucullata]|uniref:uncharacterized protein LOC134258258 n=1 Tax=Saccostrea cuccullata TaxID=36930 RepID=UPI002ED03D63